MLKFCLGVVITSVVLFFWGFLFWGINQLPYQSWKQTRDDRLAGEALVLNFPEQGTYFVPNMQQPAEERSKKFAAGPVAFVHMLAPNGRPEMDPGIMLRGFLLNVGVILLIGLQLRQIRTALPTYASRVGHAALVGLTAALLINMGDVVWWGISVEWKAWQALYSLSAWTLAAAVMAGFVDPPLPKTAAPVNPAPV